MNKPQKKRLNDLEAKYNIGKKNKPPLLLFTNPGYETLEEFQAYPDKPRMTQREATEKAFKLSGKPGEMKDYRIMNIQGVSVKPSEDAVTVYSVHEMNSRRDKLIVAEEKNIRRLEQDLVSMEIHPEPATK